MAIAAAGLALAGCALEPAYRRPAPAIPATWPTGAAYPAPDAAATAAALSYRDVFHDAELVGLIDQALANNQDLRATLANVEIARAQLRLQRSELYPHMEADFNATQTHAPLSTSAGAPVQTERSYQADLSLTQFEIDLFGRLRSLSHAAFEQYLASAAGARAARLTLVGDVSRAYFTLAVDRSQLAVATDTVDSAQRTVALTEARLKGGVAPRTELAQARTVLDQARADEQRQLTQVAQDRNALERLVGAPVADASLPAGIEAVDGLIGEVPAGLDSRILLRRPDVLEAEHRLRAANAEIGAARAAFFPTINLTGLAGYASPALSALFDHGRFAWQTNGAATLPVFAGGANLANLSLARAQREQAVAQYQAAVQSAFRDVADALARRGTMEAQLAAQHDLTDSATSSFDLETARYKQGIEAYLGVLVAQRTLYVARQSLAAARLARAENLIAIYQAVGADPLIESMPLTASVRR